MKKVSSQKKRINHESKASPSPFMKFMKAAAGKVFTIFRRSNPPAAVDLTSKSMSSAGGSYCKSVTIDAVSSDLSRVSNSSKSTSKLKSSSSYCSSTSGGVLGTQQGYTLQEIAKATNNFSSGNKIGEGSFGTVYKGKLRDGTLIAVKRAKKNLQDNRLALEFRNEILTLSKIEHMNLVRLCGYVEHQDERLIVVEYVNNGNLRQHLDNRRGTILEFAERLDIAIDVAHAITYLHMYTDRAIIHRDIKASNILLNDKLRAKVADFGFARLASEDCNDTHISTQIKGTTGYLDPEYLKTYTLTEKSDVFSFGVLLVEIVTGRHPIDQNRSISEKVTIKWAMKRLKDGDAIMVMDPILRRSPASNRATEDVLRLAHKCLAPLRQSRPSMKECAEVLWRIRKEFRERNTLQSNSASSASADFPRRNPIQTRITTFGMEDISENPRFVSA
ncbi:Calmodulin-binding receptor-like cytoplasmic kinase 1 [Linum perenne]